MLVFREGRRTVPGPAFCHDFRASLRQLAPGAPSDKVLDLLLRAGEVECALADANSPLADSVSRVTDSLSAWLVSGGPRAPLHWAPDAPIPERLTVSRPEGFAYYALHPLEYADAVQRIASADRDLAVVGVRSIGTTLSAVVAASAKTRARRITVRPHGHPFNRVLHLSPAQRDWIAASQRAGAHFVIVDEGPGLSGSSFLAVAEALVQAGVSEDRLTLLGSTEPDLEALRAPAAAERWARFRLLTVRPPWRKPAEASISVGEGRWRDLLKGLPHVPASWICFERQKYLPRDGRTLFKFEGLGPYGDDVLQRARALASRGYSPAVSSAGEGFLAYDWIEGRPPDPHTVTTAQLDRIAEYCAWRASQFPAASPTPLGTMLRTNLEEEFGQAAAAAAPEIEYRRVAIVDGRMQPPEWIATDAGLLKLDSATHGDDHFFPGATDIAWDLAGAIAEWELNGPAADYLLTSYARLSGDDVSARMPAYLLAYMMFRLGYCRLAAESMSGSEEAIRFCQEAEQYRRGVLHQLGWSPASARQMWVRRQERADSATLASRTPQ